MNTERFLCIQEEFGDREIRKDTFFHYNEERYKAYLDSVPSYIPHQHKKNVAKRIANSTGLIIRDSVEKLKNKGVENLYSIRQKILKNRKEWNGFEWLLSVSPSPQVGEIAVGESQFAITDGSKSVFQTRVGGCLGIIFETKSHELFTTHVYPIFFERHQEFSSEEEKIRAVCQMYLYQIRLIYPSLDPTRIILNSSNFNDQYKKIFERILRAEYASSIIGKYEVANLEYDPTTREVYKLTSDSLLYDDKTKAYILRPVRVGKLD
ncbi:MAG: hypothetical protein ABI425_06120 [Patescibacteria group bacterium]